MLLKLLKTLQQEVKNTEKSAGKSQKQANNHIDAKTTSNNIANGHAYEKHVVKQKEFTDLGIKTRAQFAEHIERIINNPSDVKKLENGRTAYWDDKTGTIVIVNPKAKDSGSAYRPTDGKDYFNRRIK
ncbi:MAG: hypothetical protein J6M05_05385 [Cardiobacteriaceae bacterium]|nr:hypothetical protein [Cardiobacteriaceae bacterium]